MGCGGSKSGPVYEQGKPGNEDKAENDKNTTNNKNTAEEEDEEEDEFVAVEEAVAYVKQELAIDGERALRMVLSVSKGDQSKVSCIAIVLLNERIKEIKEELAPKFEAEDPDGTGHVRPETAIEIMTTHFGGLPVESAKQLVERFDKDGNSQVDFCEFIEFYAFIKSKRTELETIFDELDTDSSGDLDIQEVIDVLMRECCLQEFQARALVDDFDVDKNGTLDRNEFMSMWMKLFG